MKVIGVVGGPRRGGNTARLVEEVLAGAREAGNETHVFYLCDMDVRPLEADGDGYLYPEDDFVSIMPHLESMGGIVVGSPIYYDHVCSRTKTFIDRLYYYSRSHGDMYRELFPGGVRCVNLVTCGKDDPGAYDEVLEWMNGRMTHYWGMEILGNLKAYGTGKRPVKENEALLIEARELGKRF
ncbi:flavodoxin family protein [Candidatus Bathyarchaeota archaeon]|nr:flavodoxin family protein [Candidatus Bathyarchaeota archaeon]